VLRERRIVGIVSRADLLRALAAEPPPRPAPGLLASAIAGLEERFLQWKPPEPAAAALPAQRPASNRLAVADFQRLVTDCERKQAEHREEARRVAAIEHRQRVAELIDQHISEEGWRDLLHRARNAAQHGQPEFMLLRGSRANSAAMAAEPSTFRNGIGRYPSVACPPNSICGGNVS
jgi:hypothetical protein